jgi:phage terminase large subunit-like protein
MTTPELYITNILSGEIPCGHFEKLAVQRHINDLEDGINRGLYFDKKAANKALRWFEFIRHSKGVQFVGKQFVLSPWQAFIIWSLFGWKRADDTRRFRKAYISVAKKNGKTAFAAGIALYMLKADGEPRSEVYSGATKYAQASLSFDEAKAMIRKSPELSDHFNIFAHSITEEFSGSFFQPLASDSEKQDGLNPHFVLIDEYHAHKTNELLDNLQSGTAARIQPLLMMITTAGFNRFSPCFDEEKTCKQILEGIIEQDDKFAMIFAIDEKDNWEDPEVWIKANPNLNISVNIDFLANEYKEAINNPRKVVNFQTKNLNMWVDSATGWIKHSDWMACKAPIDPSALEGQACYGGLDLAAHEDFNAFTLVFDEKVDGNTVVLCFFWIPEAKTTEKRERVDYRSWVREKWIMTTPGNVIDIDQEVADILAICKKYDVKSIGFDPYRAYHGVVQALQAEDIHMNEFRQRTVDFDAPTRELEKLVLSRKLNHLGNPVLAWMVSNVGIMEDSSGNIKASKGRSSEKIDGVISTIMALGEKMTFSNITYSYLS